MGNSQSNRPDDDDDSSYDEDMDSLSEYEDDDSGLYSSSSEVEEDASAYSQDDDDVIVVQNDNDALQQQEDDAVNGEANDIRNNEEEMNGDPASPTENNKTDAAADFWEEILPWMETLVAKDDDDDLFDNVALIKLMTKETILQHITSSSPEVQYIINQSKQLQVELERRYTPVALKILDLVPQVRNIRFQLVPGRIKEHAFWATVFCLLKENYQDIIASSKKQDESSTTKNNHGSNKDDETHDKMTNGTANPVVSNSHEAVSETTTTALSSTYGTSFQQIMDGHGSAMHVTDSLQRQIKEKTWHILKLEKQLEQANTTIRELRQSQQDCSTAHAGAADDDASSSSCGHAGNWVLTRDAQDFLALDDEIKENLRKEKAKRLESVRMQMKFILDSDDLKDSFGEWDCCHETSFDAKCKKNSNSRE